MSFENNHLPSFTLYKELYELCLAGRVTDFIELYNKNEKHIDLNYINLDGDSLLTINSSYLSQALLAERFEIIKFLQSKGFSMDERLGMPQINFLGRYYLSHKWLMENFEDERFVKRQGLTQEQLDNDYKIFHPQIRRFLLDNGADMKFIEPSKNISTMHCICMDGEASDIEFFFNLDRDYCASLPATILFSAFGHHRLNNVEYLLSKGFDINVKNESGFGILEQNLKMSRLSQWALDVAIFMKNHNYDFQSTPLNDNYLRLINIEVGSCYSGAVPEDEEDRRVRKYTQEILSVVLPFYDKEYLINFANVQFPELSYPRNCHPIIKDCIEAEFILREKNKIISSLPCVLTNARASLNDVSVASKNPKSIKI